MNARFVIAVGVLMTLGVAQAHASGASADRGSPPQATEAATPPAGGAAAPAGAAQPAGAGDVDAGKTKYAAACAQCHGPVGRGMASFPSVRGRDAEYVAMRLAQYRAREQVGPNSLLMIPTAVDLTDDEISNLAAFISTTFR
ncbi:MAG: c-type cytochrome [Microvirga sp.]|nr:c-type cytochrome [Microvirga sp.]